jgi:hypothetical protein
LLGQIAKNAKNGNSIDLAQILDVLYNVLADVQHKIGGRVILLECDDKQPLIELYEKQGFSVLQKEKYVQMYKLFDV